MKTELDMQGGYQDKFVDYDDDEVADEVSGAGGTPGYGWKYNFRNAFSEGVILPANPANPAVFELKHPNENIKGVVR